MLKSVTKITFLGFCLFSNLLLAQTELNEITVTASKTTQKLSQTGKVLIVLTDSLLQKHQSQTLGELLSSQAGITIAGSNGTIGTNQELYVRGASNGNTLILIDGVPAYDPTYISAGFDLNLIQVTDCERIEILKGSQSTLYGSDAVAGVINIFTKKGSDSKPISTNISIQGGSFNTFRNLIGLNGLKGKFNYNIQNTNLFSRGISAAFYDKSKMPSQGNYIPKTFENDGIMQNNVLANMAYNFSDKLSLKARVILNNYKNDLDLGPYTDELDFTSIQKLVSVGTTINYKFAASNLVINYNLNTNKRTFLNDSSFIAPNAFDKYSKSFFGGNTQFVDAFWSKKVNENFQFVIGSDVRLANINQTYVSYSSFGKFEDTPIGADTTQTTLISVYGAILFNKKMFFGEVGGRLNQHSIYGNNFTYSLNPSYVFSKNIKAFANFSTGFKAPSLYQLYSPYGNKTLKPELSQSIDAGIQFNSKHKKTTFRALYFTRKQADVIFFEYVNFLGKYINFDRQHDQGAEIEGNSTIGNLSVFGNYTYLTGKISQKDTSYNNLFRRPKHSFNLGLTYLFSTKFQASISMNGLGKRIDSFFNEVNFTTENTILKAYQTLNLNIEYRFSNKLKTFLSLKNFTNTQYFDSYGYTTKPINFMVGINLNF